MLSGNLPAWLRACTPPPRGASGTPMQGHSSALCEQLPVPLGVAVLAGRFPSLIVSLGALGPSCPWGKAEELCQGPGSAK